MRFHLFTHFGFAALTLGLTAGCAGGQTGDLSGDHGEGTETSSGGCDEHRQKLASFDEMTDAGSPEQVLAYAEKSFDAPITWKVASEGQSWTASPESGTGAIHIDVTRGANAYQLTYTQKESDSGQELAAAICPPPQLGVEAHVTVTTDGGALAESYDTLLRTSTPGVTTLSVPLDLTKLDGSLAVSFSKPGAKLVQASLDATFMAEGTTGRIGGIEQVDSGGATGVSSASGVVLAVWPGSEACGAFYSDGAGLGLSLDQEALGATGTETLASVATAAPAAITWMDGTETTLTVDIEATADGCFRVTELPAELGGGPTVTYPVTINAKSADGRLDGTYLGQVVVTGTGSQRQVTASANLQLSVDDVALSGFASTTVPDGADGVMLQFESRLDGGSASGTVQLYAVTNPPCLTEPQEPMPTPGGGSSVPGCAGQSRTQLEIASWAD
jgi:hypothetical protein